MKQLQFGPAIILIILLAVSCTTPVCITSSVTPLQNKTISENLGKTKGSDTAYAVFGLYMIGRPDLDLAIQEAIKLAGGDTLINVRCYETCTWLLLLSINTVTVEGEAVKLGSTGTESAQKVKGKKK